MGNVDEDQAGSGAEARAGSLEVAPGLFVAPSALRWSFIRSSGPGGQNVNKVSTKAEVRVALERLSRACAGRGGLNERQMERLRTLVGARRLTRDDELLLVSDRHRSQRRNREDCLVTLRQLILEARVLPKVRRPTRKPKGAIEARLREKKQRSGIKSARRGHGSRDVGD